MENTTDPVQASSSLAAEAQPGQLVYCLEVWSPRSSVQGDESSVEMDVAFVASSLERAEWFMRRRPNYSTSERPWCWVLFGVRLDAVQEMPHSKAVLGRDLVRHGAPGQAWEAFKPGRIEVAAMPADILERTAGMAAAIKGVVPTTGPHAPTPEAARIAWIYDALDQGRCSTSLMAKVLGLAMEDMGDVFQELGYPRPALT